jgi:hypothetical protein
MDGTSIQRSKKPSNCSLGGFVKYEVGAGRALHCCRSLVGTQRSQLPLLESRSYPD